MADVKWIKISTNIFDDEKIMLIESLPKADSILVIWLKLLCLAGKTNNDGYFVLTDNVPYTIEMLSKIFHRKKSTVENALNVFQKFGMVEIIDEVITIPNWSKHQSLQGFDNRKEYMREYMKERRSKQNVNTCKPNKNVNSKPNVNLQDKDKDKDKDKDIFTPPTVDEVRNYCVERNNSVDAEAFVSFYESKGWLIGKNKMKDWRAAVRTWERSRKDDKQTTAKPTFSNFNERKYDSKFFDDFK